MKNFITENTANLIPLSPLSSVFFFKGISALVELPKNCVAAAVGKELSEYVAFLLNVHIHF